MPQRNTSERSLRSFAPWGVHTGPIVAAVDMTNPDATLRATRLLAAHFGVEVVALTVAEPMPAYLGAFEPGMVSPEFESERRASALLRLDAMVCDAVGSDRTWRTRVAFGAVAPTIGRVARELSSPLIVMGIGRHRPIDRFLGTETALRTIHRASCPVLAVSEHFTALARQAVLATDFSAACVLAAETAVPLFDGFATLSMVHVRQPAFDKEPGLYPEKAEIDARYLLAMPKRYRRLDDALSLPATMSVRHEIRDGDPVSELLKYAVAHDADLIVAGRHGISPLACFMVGGVTSALIRGATCSVLVTPEPRSADAARLGLHLTGLSEQCEPGEWAAQLDNFARRNKGRRIELEVDDLAIGVHVRETGYALLGAAFDAHDRRVELILGHPDEWSVHVTHGIRGVTTVSESADATGRDAALRVVHGEGQTLLTFTE